jgi:integrating conjugative element membrane protein (TIGR03745 family)
MKFVQAVKQAVGRKAAATRAAIAGTALSYAVAAQAALPPAPTGAAAGSDYLGTMRDYIGLGIGLLALVLAGMAFIAVSGGAIAKFNDWRAGKAELGDLKMVFIVGGLLLLIVIYLLTQAVGVIATSGTFSGA